MPIDLTVSDDGHHHVVLTRLPRGNLTDPFLVDSLSGKFKVADVDIKEPAEQKVLVRPLHYDKTDPRIETVSLEDFLSRPREEISESHLKFIFHMSRCGSTLVTQMLSTSDRFFVASEPPIINAILNPGLKLSMDVRMKLLRAIVQDVALCKPQSAELTFIKFRSWNTLYLEKILNEFPKTQWAFIHRNGVEVLESVLRNPPGWMRSRDAMAEDFASFLGLSTEEVRGLNDREYATRMLGAFCKTAASQKSPEAQYFDYENITSHLPDFIDDAWKANLSEAEREAMFARTKVYSKDPEHTREFTPDSEVKRAAATQEEQELSERYIETERKKLKTEAHEWTREFRPGTLR